MPRFKASNILLMFSYLKNSGKLKKKIKNLINLIKFYLIPRFLHCSYFFLHSCLPIFCLMKSCVTLFQSQTIIDFFFLQNFLHIRDKILFIRIWRISYSSLQHFVNWRISKVLDFPSYNTPNTRSFPQLFQNFTIFLPREKQ